MGSTCTFWYAWEQNMSTKLQKTFVRCCHYWRCYYWWMKYRFKKNALDLSKDQNFNSYKNNVTTYNISSNKNKPQIFDFVFLQTNHRYINRHYRPDLLLTDQLSLLTWCINSLKVWRAALANKWMPMLANTSLLPCGLTTSRFGFSQRSLWVKMELAQNILSSSTKDAV